MATDDSEMNVITALGGLKYLISCLSKSMYHLNEYVNDNLEQNSHKTVIQTQVRLLSRSIDFLVIGNKQGKVLLIRDN